MAINCVKCGQPHTTFAEKCSCGGDLYDLGALLSRARRAEGVVKLAEHQNAMLLERIFRAESELAALVNPEWTPTTDNVMALPVPILKHIHTVETALQGLLSAVERGCDPALLVAEAGYRDDCVVARARAVLATTRAVEWAAVENPPVAEHTCGACARFVVKPAPDGEAYIGRCPIQAHFGNYETVTDEPACPARVSRPTAENQTRLVESATGLLEALKSLWSVEYPKFVTAGLAEKYPDGLYGKIAAVEAAVKEIRP